MKKEQLTPNQLRAIRFILECFSIEDAAKKAKISRATLYNWMKQDTFKKRLQEERDALFYESFDFLKQATNRAVNELVSLLDSKDETTRRLAAKEILNQSLRVAELKDLDERLSKIEELVRYEKRLRD